MELLILVVTALIYNFLFHTMTICQYIASELADRGVKYVFGIPGGPSIPYMEEFKKHGIELHYKSESLHRLGFRTTYQNGKKHGKMEQLLQL